MYSCIIRTWLHTNDKFISLNLIGLENVARNIPELDSHFRLTFVESCSINETMWTLIFKSIKMDK